MEFGIEAAVTPFAGSFARGRRAVDGRPSTTRGRLRARLAAGFTLIELVIVLVLLGILFSFAAPNLSGLTPKYRMRTYARKLAGTIEKARVTAVIRGRTTGVRYVLDETRELRQHFQLLPPAPIDYPDQLLEDRESQVRLEAPTGVRIRHIILPGGETVRSGVLNVGFSPSGTTGSHIIVLEVENPEEEQLLTIKYNSISGVVDYYNHEVEFQHYEG